ncbi:MAG: DUF4157 domain-containing protein, partial [Sinomicrobium sp.]|nr:DUF4157 domain-containing protein [Sinomicrobium sp.]
MKTHTDKKQDNKSKYIADKFSHQQHGGEGAFQFADNRKEALAHKELQEGINNSPRVQQLMALQQTVYNSPRVRQLTAIRNMADGSPQAQQMLQLQSKVRQHTLQETAQRIATEEEEKEEAPMQGMFEAVQRVATGEDEEDPIQRKFEPDSQGANGQVQGIVQKQAETSAKNNTGLPDNLKTGIENLSGYGMDDVKVHYNSDKPAQLNAHAYAQGTDIHLAPGQEKHLPHETWHVVQQKQGRVKPTMQMKGKVNINDDKGLEKEADVMGAKALQMHYPEQIADDLHTATALLQRDVAAPQEMQFKANGVIQLGKKEEAAEAAAKAAME